MPSLHPLTFLFDTLYWVNDQKHVMGLPETENQHDRKFDVSCRVHICICKESRKNNKSNDVEGGDKQKKQDS